ncbi:MAG TPA: transporter substrate-binding domain-containing protein [Candidatus Baltobacteraceae bacterium]|jgi:polar amino acid transport system substrate-binding protein
MKRLTFTSILLAAVSAPAFADELDDITKAGVIRIAVPQDFAPFGSSGPDMQPQGYDIDTARLIAKGLGVKLELVPVTSANRLPYLQTRKVDLIISSLGKNAERLKVIDFSSAYAPFYSGVFGPPSITVHKADDLAGKTIGVTRGALEDLALTKIAPPTADIKRFEDNNTTISAFLSGQVQLIATGNVVAAAILAKNPPVKPEKKFIIQDSPCFIGLNKDEPKLLERVNVIIAAARKNGSLDAVSRKWLGLPLPPDLPV